VTLRGVCCSVIKAAKWLCERPLRLLDHGSGEGRA
jgi:hypothetical protein